MGHSQSQIILPPTNTVPIEVRKGGKRKGNKKKMVLVENYPE